MTRLLLAADPGSFGPARVRSLLPEVDSPGVWSTPAVDDVLTWADRLADEPDHTLPFSAFLRFFEDGNRQEYEDAYFHRRRRLGVLALAVLSGRGHRFVKPLQNVLWAVCEESTWALPAHLADPGALVTVDLFAAETASALAEIRCLLADRLEPCLASRIEAEIEARVFTPYLSDRAPWDWESARHNWAAVCGGGIGIAALWLVDDAQRLRTLLQRLGPPLDAYLSGFSDDGLCLEGMGYWTYGFGYFTAFAELLNRRSRGQTDLLAAPGLAPRLAAIAAFPEVGRLGSRDFARFSDALDEYRFPTGLTSRLARRLGAPLGLDPRLAEDLAYDRYCRWVRQLRDFLWTEPVTGLASAGPVPNPTTTWYPTAQWLIARGSVRGSLVGLAAKGGHNDEPHNHNDLGSVQLVVGDQVFLDDLGAGRYERDYFREGRYGYFVNSSRSHCVALVDGQEQRAGPGRRAEKVRYSPLPTPSLTMELTSAYEAPGLTFYGRTLTLTPETVLPLVLSDRFRFDGPGHEVVERFVTRLPVTVEGTTALVTGPQNTLRITSEPAGQVRVTPEVYAPHEGPNRTAFCIDFVFPSGVEAEIRLTFDILS